MKKPTIGWDVKDPIKLYPVVYTTSIPNYLIPNYLGRDVIQALFDRNRAKQSYVGIIKSLLYLKDENKKLRDKLDKVQTALETNDQE